MKNNGQVLTESSKKIEGNKNIITGNTNEITGDHNRVLGSSCTVCGDYNMIMGSMNIIRGDYNELYGHENLIYGNHNRHSGENNTIKSGNHNLKVEHTNSPTPQRRIIGSDGIERNHRGSRRRNIRKDKRIPPKKKRKSNSIQIPKEEKEEIAPKNMSDEKLCVICKEREKTHFIIDCTHHCLCNACTRKLLKNKRAKCPLCRTKIIKGVKKIYT